MSDIQRPVHVTADCAAWEVTYTPVTDGELAGQRERAAEATVAERELVAEADRLRGLAQAHPDELVRALARRAGLA